MNVYSIDVCVVGTAYIKAETPEEAFQVAQGLCGEGLEFSSRHDPVGDDICVDGSQFRDLHDNDETTALSPAFTIADSQDFGIGDLELVEEDIDVEEAENVD